MAKTASQTQWEDLASKIKAAGREILYGTSGTAANTAAKVATTTKGTFVLETGAMVRIKFTNANSFNGTATLAVDGTTAKNIVQKGTTTTTRYWWDAGEVVDFVYDGTNFVIVDGAPATTTYYGITKLTDSDSSSSTALALVPNSLYVTANNTICPYYSASKTYALGDKVRYSKKLYKCTTAITTAEAWNSAHWTAINPLQQQLDEAAFIGDTLSPAPSGAFVTTNSIADNAVTTAKIAADAVTSNEIINGAVTASKIDFSTLSGNYSLDEVDTGYTWVDGSHIYKKTVYRANVAVGSPSNIAHGITNLKHCIKYEAFEVAATNSTLCFPTLAGTSGSKFASVWVINPTNIQVFTSLELTNVYITLYYTKAS